jgi:carboxyl-terminal processing protease
LTDHGRQVYSGGGIAPDIEIEAPRFNEFQAQLARGFVLEKFVQRYLLDHPDAPTDWEPNAPAIREFRQFLAQNNPELDPADVDRNLDYLKREIKRHVYTAEFDLDVGERAYFALDPEVEKALDLLPVAQALLDNPESLIAQAFVQGAPTEVLGK